MSDTIVHAFTAAVRHAPTTPLLTWYDDASGDRTELSGATLDNWVAKTANLFVDGLGLSTPDRVAVLLPPHWQSAAVLLGAWSAGLAVQPNDQSAPVAALFTDPAGVDAASAWPADDRYATGLLPLAMPLRTPPAGYQDYVLEVRAYGDQFRPSRPVTPTQYALGELTHAALADRARERADALGFTAGGRVLIDAARYPDPVDWLLAPLVVGASIVLVGSADRATLEARLTAEKVTATAL